MRRLWRWFLAYYRLSDDAVCELSQGRAPFDDYHDYPDSEDGRPWHFHEHHCRRCGKAFYI